MKNDQRQKQTWLNALTEAAKQQHFELPAFNVSGMGALRSVTTFGNRFVTLKRLLRGAKSDFDGIVWALWQELDDQPILVAAFHDALELEVEHVGRTLTLLKGWLLDQWTADETKREVCKHPGVQTVKPPPDRVALAR